MKTDILIIGGGLAGLSLAWQLQQRGLDYQLIEARARLGGRINAHTLYFGQAAVSFDTGPSWFWPGQARTASLIHELGLKSFEQYDMGDVMFEDESGGVQRGYGYASMQGSLRLKGGLYKLISGLEAYLPSDRYALNCHAKSIEQLGDEITTLTTNKTGAVESITSKTVVLALPPRVVAEELNFKPSLSDEIVASMNNIPTWMAGHAKVVAIYDEAFWRNDGLSGDVTSRRGPLVEVHDASPESHLSQTCGPYALFGFVGVPVATRAANRQMLIDASIDQLVRLFGEKAKKPLDIVLQDWALEPETATSLDCTPLAHHPDYGLPTPLKNIWGGKIILSSTEVAPKFGGYLEGALEASVTTLKQLTDAKKS